MGIRGNQVVPRLLIVGLVTSAVLGGCGSGSTTAQSQWPPTVTPYQVVSTGRPIGPPSSREGIDAARRRIDQAIASKDCGRIGPLYTIGSPSRESRESCSLLVGLAQTTTAAGMSSSYGEEAGVLDYVASGESVSLVLVRQADGLFHIAFPVAHRAPASVGTEIGKDADAVAATLVNSVRAGSCAGFLSVVDPHAGVGSLPRDQACDSLQNDPIRAAAFNAPDVRPRRLGGNRLFAFYAFDTPGSYLTIVLARGDTGDPSGALGSYGYIASFVTNESGDASTQ